MISDLIIIESYYINKNLFDIAAYKVKKKKVNF